jgi:hypothetical protein
MENEPPLKKKRGRRKKTEEPTINIIMTIEEPEPDAQTHPVSSSEIVLKKRGRKPKGGKIILKPSEKIENTNSVANVILHLKCSTQDLNEHNNKITHYVTDPLIYNPSVPPNIMSFNINENNPFSFYQSESIETKKDTGNTGKDTDYAYNDARIDSVKIQNQVGVCSICNNKNMNIKKDNDVIDDDDDDSDVNIKDINSKLKKLKLQLYKTTNPDKKSACFWCTYDYDNQPCYIPKYEMDGRIYGYGSFCRPECAVAFLMEEKLDDSTKFERYHLLNQIYSKVYDFKKNIKPAPNPYFLLDKFYGNLSIQEYRKLLKTEHMLLVIDKPMTRILPELHEDNEEFITNIYGGKQQQSSGTGMYKVKRQSEKQKGPSKSSIMKENFGF